MFLYTEKKEYIIEIIYFLSTCASTVEAIHLNVTFFCRCYQIHPKNQSAYKV